MNNEKVVVSNVNGFQTTKTWVDISHVHLLEFGRSIQRFDSPIG